MSVPKLPIPTFPTPSQERSLTLSAKKLKALEKYLGISYFENESGDGVYMALGGQLTKQDPIILPKPNDGEVVWKG